MPYYLLGVRDNDGEVVARINVLANSYDEAAGWLRASMPGSIFSIAGESATPNPAYAIDGPFGGMPLQSAVLAGGPGLAKIGEIVGGAITFLPDQVASFMGSLRGTATDWSSPLMPITPAPGDDYGIYGEGEGEGPDALQGSIGGIAVVGAIGLSKLARVLGPVIVAAIRKVAVGGIARWSALPGWVRTALVIVGVTVGTDILIDSGPDDRGIIQVPGTFDESSPVPGIGIVGSWDANGTTFYRLADGRLAVKNKKGRWKVWRPKKPIVLYAGGAGNLRTMLRGDRALNRQAKSIGKMLNRRAPKRAQSRCGTCNFVRCRCK